MAVVIKSVTLAPRRLRKEDDYLKSNLGSKVIQYDSDPPLTKETNPEAIGYSFGLRDNFKILFKFVNLKNCFFFYSTLEVPGQCYKEELINFLSKLV